MILTDSNLLSSVLNAPAPRHVRNGADLVAAMKGGARLIQAYQPRWPGDSPREVFLLQRGEERVGVRMDIAVRAIRRGLIRAAGRCEGFEPREWILREGA